MNVVIENKLPSFAKIKKRRRKKQQQPSFMGVIADKRVQQQQW